MPSVGNKMLGAVYFIVAAQPIPVVGKEMAAQDQIVQAVLPQKNIFKERMIFRSPLAFHALEDGQPGPGALGLLDGPDVTGKLRPPHAHVQPAVIWEGRVVGKTKHGKPLGRCCLYVVVHLTYGVLAAKCMCMVVLQSKFTSMLSP